jgi:hypothetical protein
MNHEDKKLNNTLIETFRKKIAPSDNFGDGNLTNKSIQRIRSNENLDETNYSISHLLFNDEFSLSNYSNESISEQLTLIEWVTFFYGLNFKIQITLSNYSFN